jgi:two-component system, OmpR family, phosphate regulon sensor histidine kinase PhoR
MSLDQSTKTTALRVCVWVGLMAGCVLLTAWQTDWQTACWVALAWGAVTMVWHLMHLQVLLSTLQSPSNAAVPTATGLWGEAFYYLHRLRRQHALDIAELKTQQERFMQAVQASPNAFVMLDDAGRVAWMNRVSQTLLGLEPARDMGQNLAYLLRTPAVAALLDSTRVSAPITVLTQGKTIAVQAFPFGDQQTLLLGQDLTELERTERVRRDFVANVSHELRTPLTVLSGYAELLHDHAEHLPLALQEAVGHMLSHTQRMNQLTHDLLQLATLDAAGTQLAAQSTQPIHVHQWLSTVRQSTAPLATHAAAPALRFEVSDESMLVEGVVSELHSALSNLVSNALRYTPATGTVHVSAQRVATAHGDECHVCVRDTGCGIAAEHLPRLTERFYRVSASRSRAGASDTSGTGLGLAIVKHIMLRHGGELRIASELGRGSAFTLVLPLQHPAHYESFA